MCMRSAAVGKEEHYLEEVLVQLLTGDCHQLWQRHLLADFGHFASKQVCHGLICIQDLGVWADSHKAGMVVHWDHCHHDGLGCSYTSLSTIPNSSNRCCKQHSCNVPLCRWHRHVCMHETPRIQSSACGFILASHPCVISTRLQHNHA